LTPSVLKLILLLKGSAKKQYGIGFFLDPFSTKVDFITEGVSKKAIRYWFFFLTPSVLKLILLLKGSTKNQYGIGFFLDPFSTKNAFFNQKSSRFSLDKSVITVGLGRMYR
jgi:hypothetical protein